MSSFKQNDNDKKGKLPCDISCYDTTLNSIIVSKGSHHDPKSIRFFLNPQPLP